MAGTLVRVGGNPRMLDNTVITSCITPINETRTLKLQRGRDMVRVPQPEKEPVGRGLPSQSQLSETPGPD